MTASLATWREAAEARRRPTNPRLPRPSPPGPWVNGARCRCGARYDDHRTPGLSFGGAQAELVAMGAPFASRGPVLWWMHVIKLGDWYAEHSACGDPEPVTPQPAPGVTPAPSACPCRYRCPWCEAPTDTEALCSTD